MSTTIRVPSALAVDDEEINDTFEIGEYDDGRTPEEKLNALPHKRECVSLSSLFQIPESKVGRVYLYAFKSGPLSDDELERKHRSRDGRAIDPSRLMKYNEKNPEFAKTHGHITHWKGEDGQWHYLGFRNTGVSLAPHRTTPYRGYDLYVGERDHPPLRQLLLF